MGQRKWIIPLACAVTLIVSVLFAVPAIAQDASEMFLPFLPKREQGQSGTAIESESTPLPDGSAEPIVRLPLFTEEELAAIRGIPTDPNDPNTLYLPPGVSSLEELPECPLPLADDPSTEVNEVKEEYEKRLQDGREARNAQARVVQCRYVAQPDDGISMTPEEFEQWSREHGSPVVPDPITDHPEGALNSAIQSSNAPQAILGTPKYSWAQYDLLSTGSPDLKLGTFQTDVVFTLPTLSGGQSWTNSAGWTRIASGSVSSSSCSGMGLDKYMVGAAKGKWHPLLPAITSGDARLVYWIATSGKCAFVTTTYTVYDGAYIALKLEQACCNAWNLYASAPSAGGWVFFESGINNWNENYARRIAAGSEIFADNEQKHNVHFPGETYISRLIVSTPSGSNIPWWHTSVALGTGGTKNVYKDSPFTVFEALDWPQSFMSMIHIAQ